MNLEISPVSTVQGAFRPPSDKSLTHRAYMFGAMAAGDSSISHPLRGEDCEATLQCLHQLGLQYEWQSGHACPFASDRRMVDSNLPIGLWEQWHHDPAAKRIGRKPSDHMYAHGRWFPPAPPNAPNR